MEAVGNGSEYVCNDIQAQLAQLQSDLYVIYSGSSSLPCRSGEALALQSPLDMIQMCMSQDGSRQKHGKIQGLRTPGREVCREVCQVGQRLRLRLNFKSPAGFPAKLPENYWSTLTLRVFAQPSHPHPHEHSRQRANPGTAAACRGHRQTHMPSNLRKTSLEKCAVKFVADLPTKKIETQADSLQVRLPQLKPSH